MESHQLSRFEKKFEAVPEAGCWLWTGGTSPLGYGYFHAGMEDGKKKTVSAHRMAWSLYKGDIPEGSHVLHRCDVPCCVNPEHLFLGSHVENMQDRDAKGRNVNYRGEAHGSARLSEQDVLDIRASSRTQRDLAKRHGVTQAQISLIVRRKLWKHI